MIITYDELKHNLLLQNPGERSCSISFRESGWYKKQVFTSKDFPEKIPYQFIGLVKLPNGVIHPKYKAEVVTRTKLHLSGKTGIKNGIDIMNRICHELCHQNDFYEAKSIKRSDLQNSGDEKISYWLASEINGYIMSVEDLGESIPVCGAPPCSNNSMIFPHNLCSDTSFSIRPVIILGIEVSVNLNSNILWTSL